MKRNVLYFHWDRNIIGSTPLAKSIKCDLGFFWLGKNWVDWHRNGKKIKL